MHKKNEAESGGAPEKDSLIRPQCEESNGFGPTGQVSGDLCSAKMNDLLYFQNGPREMQGVEIRSDENVRPGCS